MTYLRAHITRWADDAFPGWVEITFPLIHIDRTEPAIATVELSHGSTDLEGNSLFRVPLTLLGDLPVDLEGG